MSKKQQNTNGFDEGPVEGEDYIITTRGERVDFLAVSNTLLQKTQTQGTLPPVPYREVPTAFGEAQKEELTEDDLRTDEEKAQWAAYVEARDAILEKRNNDFLKAVFIKGTKVNEEKLEAWKKEQVEEWGFELPEKGFDMKLQYIQEEIASDPIDQMNIIVGVLGKSGLPEKEREKMRAMFRGALRQNPTVETED